MISRRAFLGGSTFGSLALLGVGGHYAWQTGRIQLGPADLPDAALPPVPGVMRDGQPVPGFSSADRDERVLLLNFWASWCPYCRSEHDVLMKLAEDRRLKLIGIVSDDREAHVAQYLGEHGNPYAQLSMDHQKVVIRAMRQRGLPTTMLIPAGTTRVVFRHVGPITEPLIQPAIASALLPYQVG